MRRAIPLLILAVTTALIAACAEVTAPTPSHPQDGPCSGYVTSGGQCVDSL